MDNQIVLQADFDNIKDASRFYQKMSFIDRELRDEEFYRIGDDYMWVSVDLQSSLSDEEVANNRALFEEMARVHNATSISLNFYGEDQMVVK